MINGLAFSTWFCLSVVSDECVVAKRCVSVKSCSNKQIGLPDRYSVTILLYAAVWPQFLSKFTVCISYMFANTVACSP